MKATELMIGDWVQNPLGAKGWVKNIRSFPQYRIDIAYSADGESYAVLEEKDVNPIRLTPEILKKNGFKFDGSGQRSMMLISEPHFSEGIRYNIYVGLKKKTIEVFVAHPVEKSPNWRKSNKVYLEVCGLYVHELQHAIKLCGIEKEIQL